MLIEQRADDLLVWAPAKVNLYLEVLRKRPDGFHELETIMIAVNLFDTLRFKEDITGKVTLLCSDSTLAIDQSNLVIRSADLLRHKTGCHLGASICLTKRIPMAAGLGGGSSNSAATLAGLNRLWRLGLSRDEMAALGAELGSDVPFFFFAPAATCTGRGEKVAPKKIGKPLWLVLLKPPLGLPTANVFAALQLPEKQSQGITLEDALQKGDNETVRRLLHNRLQSAAEKKCPELAQFRKLLEKRQPAGICLSGSGTTWFVLCESFGEASRIAWGLRSDPDLQPGSSVYVVRSCRQ